MGEVISGTLYLPDAALTTLYDTHGYSQLNWPEKLSPAGDINGDGLGDFLHGASSRWIGEDLGTVYLVFAPYDGSTDIDDHAVRIVDDTPGEPGPSGRYSLGDGFTALGDQTGDGLPELAVGATGYVDFGPNGGWDSSVDGAVFLLAGPVGLPGDFVSTLEAITTITNPDSPTNSGSDEFGCTLAAGDLNDDGVADLLVAADTAEGDSGMGLGGEVFIFYGPIPAGELTSDDAADVHIYGSGGIGHTMEVAGDINGDGASDLAMSSSRTNHVAPSGGSVHVFLGPVVDGVKGVDAEAIRWGEEENDKPGLFLAAPGDLDGDGYDDLAAGAVEDFGGESSGSIYVMFGPIVGHDSVRTAETRYDGVEADDGLFVVRAAGDLNLDGVPDLLLAASGPDAVYLITDVARGGVWAAADEAQATITRAEVGISLGDATGDCVDDLLLGHNGAYLVSSQAL